MEVEDRRATIEAAFEAAEKDVTTESAVTPVETPAPVESQVAPKPTETESVGAPPAESAVETPVGEKPVEKPVESELDRPPQSWKPAEKAKWGQLDPDIRQEVLRREHQVTAVLNETTQARQLANNFQQAVQPYMARIQSQGANPIQAIQSLLQADHLLSSANKTQRAQFMAKLVSDYDVDIVALDAALAGKQQAPQPEDMVNQLVNQRLAPFEQYMAQQRFMAQQQEQANQQQALQTVEQMATDPRFPHFSRVRNDMADFIEIAAKKNIVLGLEAAYNKAVMLDPTLSAQPPQGASAAASANERAQRALKASSSVSGAPSAAFSGSPTPTDRRAAISAAFDNLAGR